MPGAMTLFFMPAIRKKQYSSTMLTARKTYHTPAAAELLQRKNCLHKADEIIKDELISGMSRKDIAKELYFHASVYHICRFLEKHHIRFSWLLRHADPIDLADGGDVWYRRAVFSLWWLMPEIRKPKIKD